VARAALQQVSLKIQRKNSGARKVHASDRPAAEAIVPMPVLRVAVSQVRTTIA
jgi:hypothetical protein